MKASLQDKFYHQKSLLLAKMFKALYDKHGSDNKLTVAVKEKYIAARREITKNEDGERYGHAEAYNALRG
jgi:hypothetical protein